MTSRATGPLPYGSLGGESNVYVDLEGIKVTDGTQVRVRIGQLPNGSYGLRILSSAGEVLIDGEQITLTGSTGTIGNDQIDDVSGSKLDGGTIPAGVALGISQTSITSSGVKVATGGVDRVILGALGGGDYGLKVVNGSSVVIINGTSDMFRIAASGTFNLTGCNGTSAQCTATTSATIATGFTYKPAHLAFMDSSDGRSRALPRITTDGALPGAVTDQIAINIDVTVGTSTLVTLNWVAQGANRSAENRNFRYFILEQVGL